MRHSGALLVYDSDPHAYLSEASSRSGVTEAPLRIPPVKQKSSLTGDANRSATGQLRFRIEC
jgi:hypothetical protein